MSGMELVVGFLVGCGITAPVAFALGRFERRPRVIHVDGPYQTLRSIKSARDRWPS